MMDYSGCFEKPRRHDACRRDYRNKRTECMNDLTKRVIDCSNTPIKLHLLHCSSKKRLKMTIKKIEDVTVALRNDKKNPVD